MDREGFERRVDSGERDLWGLSPRVCSRFAAGSPSAAGSLESWEWLLRVAVLLSEELGSDGR